MGVGVAASWLNENRGFRSIYLQPNLTHVPNPGANRRLSPATAVTMRVTVLF